jgi:hypothetical protein
MSSSRVGAENDPCSSFWICTICSLSRLCRARRSGRSWKISAIASKVCQGSWGSCRIPESGHSCWSFTTLDGLEAVVIVWFGADAGCGLSCSSQKVDSSTHIVGGRLCLNGLFFVMLGEFQCAGDAASIVYHQRPLIALQCCLSLVEARRPHIKRSRW